MRVKYKNIKKFKRLTIYCKTILGKMNKIKRNCLKVSCIYKSMLKYKINKMKKKQLEYKVTNAFLVYF